MAADAECAIDRARRAVGAAFRAQGRTIEEGLDCVGLAAFAFALAPDAVPRDYPLRGTTREAMARHLAAVGFARADRLQPIRGDLALFLPGPGQLHLAILTGTTMIHADAGLRRVVERPMPPPWPLAELWRLEPKRERH
ncbi:MAG TPA: peptidoglycan endopeptidase [Allosphingosinicella sp.]